MKVIRIIKLTAIAIMLLAVSAKAQFFVGGGFGVSTNSLSAKVDNKKVKGESAFSFNFSPTAGIVLSDNLFAGLRLGYNMQKNNDNQDPATKTSLSAFSVAPFADYIFAKFGKFSVAADAQLPLSFQWSSTTIGTAETKAPSILGFGLAVSPILLYSVNDNFKLSTSLNFMRLNFNVNTTSKEVMGIKASQTETSFNIGANMNNIVNVGAITIGAIYIF